jgi:hypothetical protein
VSSAVLLWWNLQIARGRDSSGYVSGGGGDRKAEERWRRGGEALRRRRRQWGRRGGAATAAASVEAEGRGLLDSFVLGTGCAGENFPSVLKQAACEQGGLPCKMPLGVNHASATVACVGFPFNFIHTYFFPPFGATCGIARGETKVTPNKSCTKKLSSFCSF